MNGSVWRVVGILADCVTIWGALDAPSGLPEAPVVVVAFLLGMALFRGGGGSGAPPLVVTAGDFLAAYFRMFCASLERLRKVSIEVTIKWR